MRTSHLLAYLLLLFTSLACTGVSALNDEKLPRGFRLPAELREASGLLVDGNELYWHNDSGDGPYLYVTDLTGRITRIDTLAADAVDYEDITQDPAGNLYVGDFGNNRGSRTELAIYRYHPTRKTTDTIAFTYPGQDGKGRGGHGNYNCEAMVFQGGYLHLFTKDLTGRKSEFYTYHYRLPARPGTHLAELRDSLYLPRRVVTAAALDTVSRQLVMTAYDFRMLLGFLPSGSASLITISDYPGGKFLAGELRRKRLSRGVPTQFEAVDFVDDQYLYVASEATVIRPRAVARLKRR